MAICDKDCFNCVHDDCINDEIDKRRQKHAQDMREWRRKENNRAIDAKRTRNRYYRLKNAGICVQCGKRPIAPNSEVHCAECLQYKRRIAVERSRKKGCKPRESMDGVTWCKLCGKAPPVKGYKHCEKCLASLRRVTKIMRTRINKEQARKNHDDFMKQVFIK